MLRFPLGSSRFRKISHGESCESGGRVLIVEPSVRFLTTLRKTTMKFPPQNIISINCSAIMMVALACPLPADDKPELTEEAGKKLAALVAANEYVAVVEINEGEFTGACMIHNRVKVMAHLKGKLGTTALFSSINADENAFLRPSSTQETVTILTAGTTWSSSKGTKSFIRFPA